MKFSKKYDVLFHYPYFILSGIRSPTRHQHPPLSKSLPFLKYPTGLPSARQSCFGAKLVECILCNLQYAICAIILSSFVPVCIVLVCSSQFLACIFSEGKCLLSGCAWLAWTCCSYLTAALSFYGRFFWNSAGDDSALPRSQSRRQEVCSGFPRGGEVSRGYNSNSAVKRTKVPVLVILLPLLS